MTVLVGLCYSLAVLAVCLCQNFPSTVRPNTVRPRTTGSCAVQVVRRVISKEYRNYTCYKRLDILCENVEEEVLKIGNSRWCYWRWSNRGYCSIRIQSTCRRLEVICRYKTIVEYRCCNGYESNGYGGCRPIIECNVNNGGCQQECHPNRNCQGLGCSKRRCACYKGFQLIGGTRCQDVNECGFNNGGCSQECTNTKGAHYCSCKNGYKLERDGVTCTEINECDPKTNPCEHFCYNTPGAFYCKCRPGFELVKGFMCNDRDECAQSYCSHNCTNYPGGYTCSCPPGFKLQDGSKRTCVAVTSSCQRLGCSHGCTSSALLGTLCVCPLNYHLLPDQRTCVKSEGRNDTDDGAGGGNAAPVVSDGHNKGVLAGAIVGGCIGLFGLIALIVLLVFLLRRLKRREASAANNISSLDAAVAARSRAGDDYDGYVDPIALAKKKKKLEDEEEHEYSNTAALGLGRDTLKQQKPLPVLPSNPPPYENPPAYDNCGNSISAEPVYDNSAAARASAEDEKEVGGVDNPAYSNETFQRAKAQFENPTYSDQKPIIKPKPGKDSS